MDEGHDEHTRKRTTQEGVQAACVYVQLAVYESRPRDRSWREASC